MKALLASAAVLAALAAPSAQAQRVRGSAQPARAAPKPVVSQPVVQAVPDRGGSLNAALARLARNPRDVDALIAAGNAALAMSDVDAAVGFFNRADEASPGNPRVKAGLASVLVRSENPFEAIPLFQQAEQAGAPEAALAADRGLAYDLVGDNVTAQRYYRTALANENDDEVTRRLALSFAIAGDRRSAEATLSPLLLKQDKAAWRTRAFALAILGEINEAVAVAQATLPGQLSAAVSPYLRYMPRLTPAQQAAAANLGHFPRPSEIGLDDPRIAQYAPAGGKRPGGLASADAGLVPKGEPLGRGRAARSSRETVAAAERPKRSNRERNAEQAPRAAPRPPEPSREQITAAATLAAAPVRTPAPAPAPAPTPAPAPAPVATVAVAEQPRAPAPAPEPLLPPGFVPQPAKPQPAPQPPLSPGFAAFDLSKVPARQAPTPTPTPAPAPPPAPAPEPAAAPAPAAPPMPPPVSVADAFSDFARPTIDVAPASGAVDMRRVRPVRPAAAPAADAAIAGTAKDAKGKPLAKAAAKPAPPSHPSRIWVQIATGRDKRALAFDWRRLTRDSAAAFRGKEPFTSEWGRTNRLLTGPFATTAAANAYLAQLRRAKIEGAFLWTSPAGQVVDELPGG